ncbi:MAG: YigZ family protein, partial [Erysipelotrichia bacterium]|nr:YigZ family protein [Erysipelotrichia bacterium]
MMQTVEQIFSSSLEEKKSTFLSFLCPIEVMESLH